MQPVRSGASLSGCVVRSGRFSFVFVEVNAREPVAVTSVLDGVVKPGVARPPAPIPDPRFVFIVRPIRANPYPPVAGSPGGTALPFPALLTFTLTPIGNDGRDYDVEQIVGATESNVGPRTSQFGCSGGAARDTNVQRPIATSYRLRVEYRYSDGVSGIAEGQGAVELR